MSYVDMDNMQNLLRSLQNVVSYFIVSFFEEEGWMKKLRCRMQLLPYSAKPCSIDVALRVAYLASLAIKNIEESKLTTKRDICYLCRPLFANVAVVQRALSLLADIVSVETHDLNIVAAAKGLVTGPVTFVDEVGCQVDVARFGTQGCFIPARPEKMRCIEVRASGILVFEKETVFRSILNEPFASTLLASYIVITGKGYPDTATTKFIHALATSKSTGGGLSIFTVTDADPHGVHIASCYSLSLADCQIIWLGVRPSDNDGQAFSVDCGSLLELTPDEYKLIENRLQAWMDIGQRRTHLIRSFVTAMRHFQQTGVKFELEVLSADHDESGTSALSRYVIDRIAKFTPEIFSV